MLALVVVAVVLLVGELMGWCRWGWGGGDSGASSGVSIYGVFVVVEMLVVELAVLLEVAVRYTLG